LVWPYIEQVLFTLPTANVFEKEQARRPSSHDLYKETRWMVPLVLYAGEAFLACIRGLSPEYRTNGDFRPRLQNLAITVDQVLEIMRTKVLARTIYGPEHFFLPAGYMGDVVLDPGFNTPDDQLVINPTCRRWAVGALDLVAHDDGFFAEFMD